MKICDFCEWGIDTDTTTLTFGFARDDVDAELVPGDFLELCNYCCQEPIEKLITWLLIVYPTLFLDLSGQLG